MWQDAQIRRGKNATIEQQSADLENNIKGFLASLSVRIILRFFRSIAKPSTRIGLHKFPRIQISLELPNTNCPRKIPRFKDL